MSASTSDITLKDLEQRKERLQAELHQIQFGIDDSYERVKNSVSSKINPSNLVRKQPFKAISVAVIAGFVFGLSGKKKGGGNSRGTGFSNYALDELKRLAASRAIHFVIDTIDENFVNKIHREPGERDDSER